MPIFIQCRTEYASPSPPSGANTLHVGDMKIKAWGGGVRQIYGDPYNSC